MIKSISIDDETEERIREIKELFLSDTSLSKNDLNDSLIIRAAIKNYYDHLSELKK